MSFKDFIKEDSQILLNVDDFIDELNKLVFEMQGPDGVYAKIENGNVTFSQGYESAESTPSDVKSYIAQFR